MKYFILNNFEFKIDYYFNFLFHLNIIGQCILYSDVISFCSYHHASSEHCNYKLFDQAIKLLLIDIRLQLELKFFPMRIHADFLTLISKSSELNSSKHADVNHKLQFEY